MARKHSPRLLENGQKVEKNLGFCVVAEDAAVVVVGGGGTVVVVVVLFLNKNGFSYGQYW